jgi:hypothetical protein
MTPSKTDAGNGTYEIRRVSNILRSPSPDPKRPPGGPSPSLPPRRQDPPFQLRPHRLLIGEVGGSPGAILRVVTALPLSLVPEVAQARAAFVTPPVGPGAASGPCGPGDPVAVFCGEIPENLRFPIFLRCPGNFLSPGKRFSGAQETPRALETLFPVPMGKMAD